MAKRIATSDLNHDNWDRQDEPEEAGTFSKAPEDALKKRVIKVAKRRNPISFKQNEDEKGSVFEGFSGFVKPPPTSSTAFAFLTNINDKTETPRTNGTPSKETEECDKSLDEYYAKLKGLNESVTEWITTHVNTNPFINLQPIFKDYSAYITELEKLKSETLTTKVETTDTHSVKTTPEFSFGKDTSSLAPKFSCNTVAPSFSFGSTSSTTASFGSTVGTTASSDSSISASFHNPTTSSNGKFSFTSTVIKPADNAETEEEQDGEPPKVEFTPVAEEGHIYTTRCKVFVMKGDKNYGDHGIGTLYLKPVPNGKTQLFVRADTNLGKLICNFILSESIPMKRMGNKDVMLVCMPTPESNPPPVPMLLRVKSAEEADELLDILQKHKK